MEKSAFFIKGVKINRITDRKRPQSEHMVNHDIPFPRLYVLDRDGTKLGVMSKREAIEKAIAAGLDLVVISSNPKQPVAKILDYGKFKYERKKKRKESKDSQVKTENREVRITPMIGIHDLLVKSKKAREFILEGDRVKVSLKFRGRELSRKDLGYDKLKEFFETLKDVAKIEKEPTLSGGRFLDMYLIKDAKTKEVKEKTEIIEHKENEDAKTED